MCIWAGLLRFGLAVRTKRHDHMAQIPPSVARMVACVWKRDPVSCAGMTESNGMPAERGR